MYAYTLYVKCLGWKKYRNMIERYSLTTHTLCLCRTPDRCVTSPYNPSPWLPVDPEQRVFIIIQTGWTNRMERGHVVIVGELTVSLTDSRPVRTFHSDLQELWATCRDESNWHQLLPTLSEWLTSLLPSFDKARQRYMYMYMTQTTPSLHGAHDTVYYMYMCTCQLATNSKTIQS